MPTARAARRPLHALQELFVELYAEPGRFRHRHVAVLNNGLIRIDDVVPGRVVKAVELLCRQKVGHAGANVRIANGAQRAGVVVRRKGYVVGLGHIGDFATFAQAAALGYIGHDDIDGLFFDDFAKAVAQYAFSPAQIGVLVECVILAMA